MDTLTLSSPMAVVVVGLPGAGKSFFAKQFAATFGAALVSEDKIRWTLFAHHTYSDNENAVVSEVSELLISELFRTGKTFVLDGGYNRKTEREEIAKKARKSGFQVLTIVVQTDEPTSRRRSLKRSGKNRGDQYKQSLTEAEFDRQKKLYQAPPVTKNTVVISGKHTYATQARMVLKKMIETQSSSTAKIPVVKERTKPVLRSRGPFIQ